MLNSDWTRGSEDCAVAQVISLTLNITVFISLKSSFDAAFNSSFSLDCCEWCLFFIETQYVLAIIEMKGGD